MKNYAVLTYENPRKGKNANGGLSVHIERRPGYSKANIDPKRTHLNQLVHGSPNIDEAVNKRIEAAGITRKIRKDAVLFKQLVLSGTPPHINDVLEDPSLGKEWIDTSLKFLFDMFGKDNVVNVTLHMDEHSPHLHATVVPILYTPAKSDGRKRKTEKRYKKREGVARLSAKDMFNPERSEFYQDEYASRVAKFGFERGERKAHVRRLAGEWNRSHPKEEPIPLYKPKGMNPDDYYRFVSTKVGYLLETNDAISKAKRERKVADYEAKRAEQAKQRAYTAVKAQVTQLAKLLDKAEKASSDDDLIDHFQQLLVDADRRANKLLASIRKVEDDIAQKEKFVRELDAQVKSLLTRKEHLNKEFEGKKAELEGKKNELEKINKTIFESANRLDELSSSISSLEKEQATLMAQNKAASVLSVRRVQELLYFLERMPCDESVLLDLDYLINDMKRRNANALIELERLLLDIIYMLLSLLFRSVSREFLLRFCEPVTKRYGLNFERIEIGVSRDSFQYKEIIDQVAQEHMYAAEMMYNTFKESNVLIDNPEKRTSKQYLLGLIAKGHWESTIKNIQESVPDMAEKIMEEILETLNEPAITNAYQQRLRNESEYRRKGYFR